MGEVVPGVAVVAVVLADGAPRRPDPRDRAVDRESAVEALGHREADQVRAQTRGGRGRARPDRPGCDADVGPELHLGAHQFGDAALGHRQDDHLGCVGARLEAEARAPSV